MKIKKTVMALALCVAVAGGALAFAACGDDIDQDRTLTPLAAPTNVVVNYGDDPADSSDDTVTFTGVENATLYNVYVYRDGDETAKVTQGTGTTIELAAPLDAGEYNISVIAVGDAITYGNSNGSAAIKYTVEQRTTTTLGKVSDVSMDFSKADASSAVYPTISFKGVAGAVRYSVYLYEADSTGKKTGEEPATNMSVPGSDDTAITYMMDSTNFGDLKPGYYVADITALGDGETYLDGETYTSGAMLWGDVDVAKPVVKADGTSGLVVEVTNYEDYYDGTEFTVEVYSDAACNTLVASDKFELSVIPAAMPWESDTINNKVGFKVAEEATAEVKLVADTTYYVKVYVDGDGVIFNDSEVADIVTVTPAAGEGSISTGGSGGPGGPGGPGDPGGGPGPM